jgi:hypothetical protein
MGLDLWKAQKRKDKENCDILLPATSMYLSSTMICAGIFKQSLGARNRVGIGFSYRPARLDRLAEFIPWNRFLGSMNV